MTVAGGQIHPAATVSFVIPRLAVKSTETIPLNWGVRAGRFARGLPALPVLPITNDQQAIRPRRR